MKHVLLLFLIVTSRFLAQDIRGAYIRTEWVPATSFIYKYKIIVNLFTDASMDIPRPTIPMHFGDGGPDGTFPLVATTNQNGITIKTYSATHTYPGYDPELYRAFFLDTFRVAGINNIPNSETQKIYVESQIGADFMNWMNVAAQVNNFPFNNLTVEGDKVIYNPACTDADGDSLTYQLINCYVPQYHLPVGAMVDYHTGVVSVPKDSLGLYAYCLKITEYGPDNDGVPEVYHTTWMDFTLDITPDVGVKENKAMERYWKIGPNPFSDKLSINPLNANENINALSILNTLGQIVFMQKTISGDQQLDLAFLPPGVYSLKLDTPEGGSVKKIIKE